MPSSARSGPRDQQPAEDDRPRLQEGDRDDPADEPAIAPLDVARSSAISVRPDALTTCLSLSWKPWKEVITMAEREPVPAEEHPHLQRLIDYLLREHQRGRPTHEVVNDPYVKEFDLDSIEQAKEHVTRAMALRAL